MDESDSASTSYSGYSDSQRTSGVWEKGILLTINQRLDEMKRLKVEIDSTMDLKISSSFDKEQQKIRVLLDSQRTLLMEKINSFINLKGKEIDEIFSARVEEIRDLNSQVQKSLTEIITVEERTKLLSSELKNRLKELTEFKQNTGKDFEHELSKEIRESDEFFTEAKDKLREIDDRVTKTLELQANVTDGIKMEAKQLSKKILDEAKTKIDSLEIQKNKELEEQLKSKITEADKTLKQLKTIEKTFEKNTLTFAKGLDAKFEAKTKALLQTNEDNFKKLDTSFQDKFKTLSQSNQSSIKALQDGFKELSQTTQNKFDKLDQATQKRLDVIGKATQDNLKALNQSAKENLDKQTEQLRKDANIKELKELRDSLQLIKQQFIKVIDKKINEFNKGIQTFNTEINSLSAKTDKRVELIDNKIAELTAFEENFANELGFALDELIKKKKEKK